MKNLFLPACLLAISIALLSCKKDDPPVMTGNIMGTVSLTDGYGYSLQDRSGVQVQLSFKDFQEETTTDAAGRYAFQNVPYGYYDLNLIKENYIEHALEFHLGHIGGNASTFTSQYMNEIPEFRYSIDSMQYNGESRFYIYLTLSEANRTFANISEWAHVFFSRSPDVSCENYENNFIEYVPMGPELNNQKVLSYTFWSGYYRFLPDYTSTVYCRVYPQTICDEMWYSNDSGPHPCYPQTLGKPSEVFSFTVADITSEF